jgi:hypothetical protein
MRYRCHARFFVDHRSVPSTNTKAKRSRADFARYIGTNRRADTKNGAYALHTKLVQLHVQEPVSNLVIFHLRDLCKMLLFTF